MGSPRFSNPLSGLRRLHPAQARRRGFSIFRGCFHSSEVWDRCNDQMIIFSKTALRHRLLESNWSQNPIAKIQRLPGSCLTVFPAIPITRVADRSPIPGHALPIAGKHTRSGKTRGRFRIGENSEENTESSRRFLHHFLLLFSAGEFGESKWHRAAPIFTNNQALTADHGMDNQGFKWVKMGESRPKIQACSLLFHRIPRRAVRENERTRKRGWLRPICNASEGSVRRNKISVNEHTPRTTLFA